MSFHTPSSFAPLVPTGGTPTEGRLSSGCPAGLAARLERIKRHAETETRAAEQAVFARRTKEVATLNTLAAEGRLTNAESSRRHAESYDRQQQGQAEAKAAFGLPSEAAVRKDAETAARAATESVWLAYLEAQEARFGL